MRAVRPYAEAMRIMQDWPKMSYQLLVYSVEAIANAVYKDYMPSRADRVNTKIQVAEFAKQLNVSEENAKDLAVLACEGMSWSRRKFKMFLAEMIDGDLDAPDDLFVDVNEFAPKMGNIMSYLNAIYEARSGVAHSGNAFGEAIKLGLGPNIPMRVSHEMLSSVDYKIPPVCWFERLVNCALNGYLESRATDIQHASGRSR